jgi:hypothetical protein
MKKLARQAMADLARYLLFVERQLPYNYVFKRRAQKLFGALSYLDVLSFLHERYLVRRYLEIGIRSGQSLALSTAEFRIGVDPAFSVQHELKGQVQLERATSDDFFATYKGAPFDLIFIDGLHVATQVVADIHNSLQHLSPTGLIAIHDTVPVSRLIATRRRYTAIWTGDVYRALTPFIESNRDDVLTLLVLHTGLTLLRSPERWNEIFPAPPRPSKAPFAECVDMILRDSQRVNDTQELGAVMGRFHSAR